MSHNIDQKSNNSIYQIRKQSNPEVVEHLEAALEEARAGELQSIITIKYWNDNTTSNGWAGLRNTRLLLAESLICTQLLTDWYVQAEKEKMNED